MRIQCAASPVHRIPRELVARKEIRTLEDLRGKTFGVQSIGGGFWLQTMIALDGLGIDPEKYDLKMRVLGDTATVTQALGIGGVDATVIPYSFSEAAKRAGANVLADIGKLNIPYQGTTLCFLRESPSNSADTLSRLLRGLVDAVVLIHDPSAKPEIVEILRRNFRFPTAEDAEASYKVLAEMATVEVMPDPAAWKIVQRIVSKINPKVAQVDLNQLMNPLFVRNLEETASWRRREKSYGEKCGHARLRAQFTPQSEEFLWRLPSIDIPCRSLEKISEARRAKNRRAEAYSSVRRSEANERTLRRSSGQSV